MDKNKILQIKSLLYSMDNDAAKKIIYQTGDPEILYVYAYNYNWDNGFDIPQVILDNKQCDLSIALLIFYRADGLSYLANKFDNGNLAQWSSFIKKLYTSILVGKYPKSTIGFEIPLTKVQIFKLKKLISPEENIFVEHIAGKCLDIAL